MHQRFSLFDRCTTTRRVPVQEAGSIRMKAPMLVRNKMSGWTNEWIYCIAWHCAVSCCINMRDDGNSGGRHCVLCVASQWAMHGNIFIHPSILGHYITGVQKGFWAQFPFFPFLSFSFCPLAHINTSAHQLTLCCMLTRCCTLTLCRLLTHHAVVDGQLYNPCLSNTADLLDKLPCTQCTQNTYPTRPVATVTLHQTVMARVCNRMLICLVCPFLSLFL